MKRLLRVAGVFVIVMAGGLPVGAATFTGEFSGAAEDPPNDSPGTGSAEVELDPDANLLRIDVTFSGLQSPTTIAHIHCCAPPGEGAGVATTLPTFPGFPEGVMSGSYQMSFDSSDAGTYNPAFVQANGGTPEGAEAALLAGLESGMAYFNIHTMMFGAGEIRADLSGGEPPSPTMTAEPTAPTETPVPTGTPPDGVTPTGTLPLVTPTITGTPAGTVTASITPDGTTTPTGDITGTPTMMATGSVTVTTRTATPLPTGGSPTVTGTRAGTGTVTPGQGTRTASPARTTTAGRRDFDDSCRVAPPDRSGTGGAWVLLVPAALLLLVRRRRS